MDKYDVSEGEKKFAEIKKEEFEEKYQETFYFKYFNKCPRYIYFSCSIILILSYLNIYFFIIIIIINKLLILKCNNFDIIYNFYIKFKLIKNN